MRWGLRPKWLSALGSLPTPAANAAPVAQLTCKGRQRPPITLDQAYLPMAYSASNVRR